MADENTTEKKEEVTAGAVEKPETEKVTDTAATVEESTDKEATAGAEVTAEEAESAEPVESEEEKLAAEAAAAKLQAEEEALAAAEIAIPDLRAGMTIRVHLKVKDGEKERIQVFQGIVTALRGKTAVTKTITVQKTSFGVLVERIFPLASPLSEKIEVVKIAKVRRAKLGYLKKYTKRLKETLVS